MKLFRGPGAVVQDEGSVALYFSKGIFAVAIGGRVICGPFYGLLGLSVTGKEKTSWPQGAGGLGEHRAGARLGEKKQAYPRTHCHPCSPNTQLHVKLLSRCWEKAAGTLNSTFS